MPKQGTRAEVNTFVRGLVTEASPLNYPANASLDEVNFELMRDGTRKRRLGMNYEEGGDIISIAGLASLPDDATVSTFVWKDAGGKVGRDVLVMQFGGEIRLRKLLPGYGVTSLTNSFPVTPKIPISSDTKASFASINGSLIIADGSPDIRIVKITDEGYHVSSTTVPIFVRDMWGTGEDSDDDPDFRPTQLTASHAYNLYNQGWGIPRRHDSGGMYNPLRIFWDKLKKYPSNTDSVWTGLQYMPPNDTTPDPKEALFGALYEDRLGLDVSAARGHFIIDLCRRGFSRKDAAIGVNTKYPEMADGMPVLDFNVIPHDITQRGPTVVASYSGRVFYSGFKGQTDYPDSRSPELGEYVFFSQLVRSDDEINKCYQAGDPSSRDSNEVVDTDGGFLRISGARDIMALMPMGPNLAVLASNGVWVISGGSDYGFTATNMKVDKVSAFGCVSSDSVVEVNGEILFWSMDSILRIGTNDLGILTASDFSAPTIDKLYVGIPLESRKRAVGVFDSMGKKIRWIFRKGVRFSGTSEVTELVFDTLIGSFYQHKISGQSGVDVAHMIYTPYHSVRYLTLRRLTDGSGAQVYAYTFSQYNDKSFRDWKSVDGVGIDAKAYLLTGAMTMGDSAIDKQAPYITMHFKRTETVCDANGVPKNQSSCKMCSRWEWANSVKSHRFSDLVETYRYRIAPPAIPNQPYDNGFDTLISKNKLRGKGKALSLYFETSPDKDCHILGWVLTINGNGTT